jgi:hypothetical protein
MGCHDIVPPRSSLRWVSCDNLRTGHTGKLLNTVGFWLMIGDAFRTTGMSPFFVAVGLLGSDVTLVVSFDFHRVAEWEELSFNRGPSLWLMDLPTAAT